jgi:LuxR family maltose regulon positive regulatory protein
MPRRPSAAKYTAPKLPVVVHRDRLMRRLQTDPGQHLVLIVGQAAQGKSTLAADYLTRQAVTAAWLRLEAAEAEAAAFFDLLVHALAAAVPDASLLQYLPSARLASDRTSTSMHLHPLLAALWQRLPEDIHVVLDGLEQLPASASAYGVIEDLISIAAAKGCILMLSRRLPFCKMQLRRMRRQVVCIDNGELAFTAAEIQAYFNRLYGLELPGPCAADILNLTNGWVGGIVLLDQSLNRQPRRQWLDALCRQLPSGLSAEAFDFFSEEIFETQSRPLQDVLLQAAWMDVIDPRILSDLFPTLNIIALLSGLVERNLFIETIPRIQGHPLYRLNPMFQDFLRSRFQTRIEAAEQIRLYERMAGFYLKRRQAELAVGLYLKANNFAAAARSIKKAGTDLIIRGHFADLKKALTALPEASINADPWLLLLLTLTRRVEAGPRNVADLESALQRFREQKDIRGELFALAYLIEALVFAGHDPTACRTWIRQGEALLAGQGDRPYFTFPRTVLWLQIGLAYIASGLELNRGISAARSAYLLAHRMKDPRLMANANIVAVLGLASMGDFEQADQILDRIAAIADTDAYTEYHVLRNMVNVWLALYRGDLKTARDLIEPIGAQIESFGLLFLYPAYVDANGLLQVYLGEYEAARSTGRHLLDVAALSGNAYCEGLSLRLSALRHYFQGIYDDAGAAAAHALAVLPRDDQPTLQWMRTSQLAGLIDYHLGKYDLAHARLAEARTYFAHTGNSLSLCETDLSLALVSDKLARTAQMRDYLRDGFSLASERQYDHFVILRPADLRACCHLALSHVDNALAAWPEQLLGVKFSSHASGEDARMRPVATAAAEARRPLLQIQTLGAFRVVRNGQTPIEDQEWGGRRTKLLLKAIVVHGMQDIPKDILIEDLWPDCNPEASSRNFKVTLHRLRKILEPDLGRHNRSAYIHLKDNLISLDGARCRVDVQRFLQHCKDIKRAALAKENQTILELGRQALALYQGEFLPDDPYAPWVEMKRLALKDEYIATLMTMAQIHCSQEQWEAAAKCCRSALSADPCLEQAGAMLMQVLIRAGYRSDAIKVYEQLRAALDKELGLAPDSNLTNLYRQILSGCRRSNLPVTFL